MRLNKYLAAAGVASRRQADELIKLGQVKINGQVVTELGVQVDESSDKVEVNGQAVKIEVTVVTYLLNKPRGVVTTTDDPDGKKTVMALVPTEPRVFPCGRLDADTQGLVVLTNDGDLCYQLTHPKFEHQKVYLVEGTCRDPQGAAAKLKAGVKLSDGLTKADEVKILKASGNKIELLLTIHDGRNRIVRRMSAAVKIELTALTRTRLGQFELGDLKPGEYKMVAAGLG